MIHRLMKQPLTSEGRVTLDMGVILNMGVTLDMGVTFYMGVTSDMESLVGKLPFLGPQVREGDGGPETGKGLKLPETREADPNIDPQVPMQRSDQLNLPTATHLPRQVAQLSSQLSPWLFI